MLTSHDIRKKYKDFFEKNGHASIEPAGLLPNNDATLLFVNSGMFPLVPYLLGQEHPLGKRLTNSQRCFRTDDIEEVGDQRHTTCFEMLGNRSLGDYFKKEQLRRRYEFLIDELGIDPNRLYQTTFGGNEYVGEDVESVQIMKEIFAMYGIQAEVGEKTTGAGEEGTGNPCDFSAQRIFQYSDKNWRQRGDAIGEVGGPDSETFYDTGKEHNKEFGEHCHVNCDCGRFIEIGNSVFMEYVMTQQGWKQLENQNVDFGGGLERLAMAVQGTDTVFETDVFLPYLNVLEHDYGITYTDHKKDVEVIADHIRAISLLIMDGTFVSNKDQGYYLRRLVRRVLTKLYLLNVESSAFLSLIDTVIATYGVVYPELIKREQHIHETLTKEQKAFSKNLTRGMKFFDQICEQASTLSGSDVFLLQATYGFPVDLIQELAKERAVSVDMNAYHQEVKKHKELSRQGAEKKFKSGLGDNSEMTVKYHTVTHLMHQVLKEYLSDEVHQKGSNLTAERLRFDFSWAEQVTRDQLDEIENIVNTRITNGFTVSSHISTPEEAIAGGAIGLFGEKYPDQVSVYVMTDRGGVCVSKEICTGPHRENEEGLGTFKIKSCKSIGSGMKRIKAVLV